MLNASFAPFFQILPDCCDICAWVERKYPLEASRDQKRKQRLVYEARRDTTKNDIENRVLFQTILGLGPPFLRVGRAFAQWKMMKNFWTLILRRDNELLRHGLSWHFLPNQGAADHLHVEYAIQGKLWVHLWGLKVVLLRGLLLAWASTGGRPNSDNKLSAVCSDGLHSKVNDI